MVTPRPKPPGMKIVQAAGAVIWRLAPDGQTYAGTSIPKTHDDIDVLIVHRPKYNDWSWPKGKREASEHLLACATREVEEETGYAVRLQAPLTTQRYRLGAHVTKAVYYWVGCLDLAQAPLRGRYPVKPASNREIDEVRWVAPSVALDLLTRRGDRRLLEELLMKLESGTLATQPFIVMRHGKAVSRKAWEDSDASRPLDREGVKEVSGIGRILSAYGVEHLMTSPWRRCLATAGAYASIVGADVDILEEATETAYEADPQSLEKIVGRQLRNPMRRATALCLHRPSIPAVFEQIKKMASPMESVKVPSEDPYLATAEMLVCHVASVPDELVEIADAEARPARRRSGRTGRGRERIRVRASAAQRSQPVAPKPGPPPGVHASASKDGAKDAAAPKPAPPKPGPKVTARVVAVEKVRPFVH